MSDTKNKPWWELAGFVTGRVNAPYERAGDTPSVWEQAAHDALALFAVHQQSQPRLIHEKGVGLGAATRRLANPSDAEEFESPVLRRFTSIVAAQDRATAIHHLRGLIQQLRAEGIGLDYGMLARDLASLGTKGDRNVRLRWSRELYTRRTKAASDEATTATASAE